MPISFHRDGRETALWTFPAAPKVGPRRHNPHVALTGDAEGSPPKTLLIRGTATLETKEGVPPENVVAARRCLGEAGAAWLERLGPRLPHGGAVVRLSVRPERLGILDFQQRVPSATEKAVAAMQTAGRRRSHGLWRDER